MNKKGFFALLTAAMAGAWHTVVSQLQAMFLYRVAGDVDNDDLPEKNGRAVISTIYGNTVKWNQLVKNGDFNDGTNNWNIKSSSCTIVIDEGIVEITKASSTLGGIFYSDSVIANNTHKYYICADTKATEDSTVYIGFLTSSGAQGGNTNIGNSSTEFKRIAGIVTPVSDTNILSIRVGYALTPLGTKGYAKNFMCIDLTALEYPDIETTTPTPEEVEAWLALNVGEQDYFPHDKGSLISFKGTGIKSVGFNKFNKDDVSNGRYINDEGEIANLSTRYLSNYIRVLPNTAYYFGKAIGSSAGMNHAWYDVDKHIIGSPFRSYQSNNSVITSPQNAYYLRCSVQTETLLNEFVINLSDAAKNGTYEPYWADEKPFDVTKVYGKVNGEGNYIQCFPDGMNVVSKNSNGTAVDVKDTLTADTAVRRLGYKALKDVILSPHSSVSSIRRFILPDGKYYTTLAYFNAMLVSPRYTLARRGSSTTNQEDLTIQLASPNITTVSTGWNYVKDTSEDDTVIRAAMDKSYIVYELSDYITYTNLIYSENGGVTGTPLSELKYKVDKYSTEELLVPASVAGEPTSTAIIADIDYQKKG